MKKRNWHSCIMKLLVVICAIALLPVSGFSGKVMAAEGKANLTITWDGSGDILKLYKVGDYKDYYDYDKSGTDFAKYPVDINVKDEKGLQAVAMTLAGYAVRDDLKPRETIVTDGSGSYTWSNLEYGAYMVISQSSVQEGGVAVVPVFVYLWKDMTVEAKPYNPPPTTEVEVYKVWKDNNDKDEDRPEEIRVQVIDQEGTVVREETLSEDNNWYVKVTDLPEGKYTVCEVEEDIPGEYTVKVTQDGAIWKITNTHDVPPGTTETPPPSNPPGKRIPQTGQLWWPIPLLASAGFICLIVGILRRRKNEG